MNLRHRLLSLGFLIKNIYKKIILIIGIKGDIGVLRVLVYHDIAPWEMGSFRRQIYLLKKEGWNFVEPNIYEAMIKGEIPIVGKNLLLTFDDGFKSNFEVALTILNDLDIKAIFFVVTKFVDITNDSDAHNFISEGIRPDLGAEGIPKHLTNMSWNDLKNLVNDGHVIGGHTFTHQRLSELSGDILLKEIVESADILEMKLGIRVRHFAFTFGDFTSLSPEAINLARNRFDYIYTSLRGDNSAVPFQGIHYRDTVDPNQSSMLIGAFLDGLADLHYKKYMNLVLKWI